MKHVLAMKPAYLALAICLLSATATVAFIHGGGQIPGSTVIDDIGNFVIDDIANQVVSS